MTVDLWNLLVVAAVPVVMVGAYFWRAEREERRCLREARPLQLGAILVNGSCSPERLVVQSGRPLRLLVTRTEDDEVWWDDFHFPYRGTLRELPQGGTVTVDVGLLDAGEYTYFCAQGTRRGTLVVEPSGTNE